MLPIGLVGNVNVDLIMGPVAPWPQVGTEVVVDHTELRVGGSAANTALAWTALGMDFQMAANTGNDSYGQFLRDNMLPQSLHWPVSPASSAISVGITHPNGERTFLSSKGHLSDLDWPMVKDMLDWPRLRGGWLLLSGAFLTERLAADYDALLDEAHRQDVRVAIDTGWPPAGWTETNTRTARHWAARSDCLLVNEVEALSLSGRKDVAAAAEDLLAPMGPNGIVVIKCGPDGALALVKDQNLQRVPAPAIQVSDTIGAGDIFNAGFLYGLAKGATVSEALSLGVKCASTAISTRPRRYASL